MPLLRAQQRAVGWLSVHIITGHREGGGLFLFILYVLIIYVDVSMVTR